MVFSDPLVPFSLVAHLCGLLPISEAGEPDYDWAPMEGLMIRTSIIAALLLSTVLTGIAQQQSVRTRDATSTEQAVQQQDQERIRAQITAETIALRRIYADDFLGIGPTGVVRNKTEVIADFTAHALT